MTNPDCFQRDISSTAREQTQGKQACMACWNAHRERDAFLVLRPVLRVGPRRPICREHLLGGEPRELRQTALVLVDLLDDRPENTVSRDEFTALAVVIEAQEVMVDLHRATSGSQQKD